MHCWSLIKTSFKIITLLSELPNYFLLEKPRISLPLPAIPSINLALHDFRIPTGKKNTVDLARFPKETQRHFKTPKNAIRSMTVYIQEHWTSYLPLFSSSQKSPSSPHFFTFYCGWLLVSTFLLWGENFYFIWLLNFSSIFLSFLPNLLKYNWHTALCKCKVYSMVT